ncbi:MAG: nitrite/sulfite reductase [Spirochaetia bacterium]|nr:nitrite/sulfite reductase [Spirochaetia bacterium]
MTVKFERNDIVNEELKEFSGKIEDYQNRKISADDFKHRRLLQGIYGQRQPALFMVRVKIPGGNVDAEMIEGIALAVEKYGKDVIHITTRQDVQLYYVKYQNLIPFLELLADHGLTTREASGATMRNIVTSPFAGYLRTQIFDVRPAMETFARFFMRNPETQHLPRKFKLSFSDNEEDYAVSGMHDMGFIAKIADGKPGFKVVIGGSLGSVPLTARVFKEFIPIEEALITTYGLLRAFNKHGDRSKRSEARLKFQLDKIGFEKFVSYVQDEIENLKKENFVFPEVKAKFHSNVDFNFSNPFDISKEPDLFNWYKHNVFATPRKNEYMAMVRVPLGDLSVATARALVKQHNQWHTPTDGDYITLADSQNLVLKGLVVKEEDKRKFFTEVYNFLKQHKLHGPGHRNLSDVVACLGSATCSAGITHSPGLGKELTNKFQDVWLNDERFKDSLIHISGCANSCARHHLATLGFSGRSETEFSENQQAPAYNIYFGGAALKNGNIKIARKTSGKILAKRVPQFIERVMEQFKKNANSGENFQGYLERISDDEMNSIVEEFSLKNRPAMPEEELEFDWGKDTPYVMEYGEGECS